jgi:hypothetical protein
VSGFEGGGRVMLILTVLLANDQAERTLSTNYALAGAVLRGICLMVAVVPCCTKFISINRVKI